MRVMKKNKQKMFYALYDGSEPVYELDEDGNKIVDYVDEDGVSHYRETGQEENKYKAPKEFYASISSELNELHAKSYGVDQSSIYSKIVCKKGYVPLDFGTKIWKDNEIVWKDETNHIPDGASADYTVTGFMKEYMGEDWFLLQRNN